MMNLPQRFRAELAELTQNKTVTAMLKMDDETLEQSLEIQGDRLEKSGTSSQVSLAYQTVAPLLVENQAILTYTARPERSDLKAVLVDVATPEEALNLAQREYRLDQKEIAELLPMLKEAVS